MVWANSGVKHEVEHGSNYIYSLLHKWKGIKHGTMRATPLHREVTKPGWELLWKESRHVVAIPFIAVYRGSS